MSNTHACRPSSRLGQPLPEIQLTYPIPTLNHNNNDSVARDCSIESIVAPDYSLLASLLRELELLSFYYVYSDYVCRFCCDFVKFEIHK
jgi:hypothetical protein